ncbi:hypothetical protein M3090_09665 [Bacteroides sp. ET71]|uniref:hypothetical protein n=1 Tax=Bacteroides sp. ET71 TaxID=2939421 RepID=UPI0020137A3D|nr:hypothetical protein [Bacteroides sp. ET71]MCL1616659.1 hypothetical protein [Bacteroides sp. ET71]
MDKKIDEELLDRPVDIRPKLPKTAASSSANFPARAATRKTTTSASSASPKSISTLLKPVCTWVALKPKAGGST